MTKEELEKEVRKYLQETLNHEYYDDVVMIMGFAEPREKRITELEKENKVLSQNLEDSEIIIAGLKAQIEKMKVCQNCDNWNWKHNKCEKKLKGDCFKHSKWVMRNF